MATNYFDREMNLPNAAAEQMTLTEHQRKMLDTLKAKAEAAEKAKAVELTQIQKEGAEAVAAAREAAIRAELRAGFIGNDADFERVYPTLRDAWLMKQSAVIKANQAQQLRSVF